MPKFKNSKNCIVTWYNIRASPKFRKLSPGPKVLRWYAETHKPLEYPAAADPRIISDIYHGKVRKGMKE